MNDTYERLVEEIGKQQKSFGEYSDAFAVGEQLKEIASESERNAELILTDLGNKEMGIRQAAAKIMAYADELRRKQKGSCVFVSPEKADKILREFYGLGERMKDEESGEKKEDRGNDGREDGVLSLDEFF